MGTLGRRGWRIPLADHCLQSFLIFRRPRFFLRLHRSSNLMAVCIPLSVGSLCRLILRPNHLTNCLTVRGSADAPAILSFNPLMSAALGYCRISSRCSDDRSPGHQTKRDRKKAPPKQASATPSAKAKAFFASFQAAFEERSIIIDQRAKSDFVQTGQLALVCCL